MSKMNRHQIKRRLNRVITESFRLAEIHSDNEQDVYAVRHPQMKNLYRDVAFLAKIVNELFDEVSKLIKL